MSFIVSIFLCFALAFSGTGTLPAEPETATTWTVRNVSFDNGTDSFTLDPEMRITTAVGGEKAGMHFEIESGDRVLLPVTAEFTKDTIRFAMSNGNSAYSLSNEEFAELMDLDEESAQVMTAIGDFFTSYGALLGSVYGDEEQAMACSQAVFAAMLDACGSAFEPVEIEFDGQTLEAQRAELTLTVDAAFKIMDGLRTCGMEPMEQMMDSILALCNLSGEAEYANFADLAAEIDGDTDFAMPMTVTFAATGDMVYCLMECDFGVEDTTAQMREEISFNGEETTVEMSMVMADLEPNNTTMVYLVSAQMQGPLNAPEAFHMNYDIVTTSVEQVVYEAEEDEDAEVSGGSEADSFTDQKVIHMTIDSIAEDGLNDMQFAVNYQEFYNEEELSSGVFQLTAAERREEDDSVTADVALNVYIEDEKFSLSFELNRAEAAPENYFDGLDVLEITAEDIEADGEEPSKLMSSLQNDAMRMVSDAMQLAAEESVQQAMTKLGGPEDILDAD